MVGWAVASFVFAGIGAVSAFVQRPLWRVTQSWKFKEPSRAELRDEIYLYRSVMAGVSAVMFTGIGIWILATRDEHECEQIMSRLGRAADDVDFAEGNDFAMDEDMFDDIYARNVLEGTAEDLGVELVDRHDAIDVTKDGELLGTLDELGGTRHCD